MIKYILLTTKLFLLVVVVSCNQYNREDYTASIVTGTLSTLEPIVILHPEYRDNFFPGSELVIKWQTNVKIGSVKIELYRVTELHATLTERTDNSGEFRWSIPLDTRQSVKYNIKLSDADNEKIYEYSKYFSIFY